jgi:hypothetical protein
VLNSPRPPSPFPKVFNIIDAAMKNCYVDKNIRDFSDDFPDAIYKYPDQWVESKPLVLKGKDKQIVFKGKVDGLLEFTDLDKDGKKVIGIPDLKTTIVNDNTTPMYSASLHTYAYCLENASPGCFAASNVQRLGLMVFEPTTYEHEKGEEPKLNGIHYWIEFEKDMDSYMQFVRKMATILASDDAPPASEHCKYCQIIDRK